MALAFGVAGQTLGLVGLFSKIAFADVNPAILALENLWLIALAIMIVRRGSEPLTSPRAQTLSRATS